MSQPALADPGTVDHPRRTAGVVARRERHVQREIVHRTRQDQHLLDVVVGGRAERRRIEPRVPSEDASEANPVVASSEHPLPDAGTMTPTPAQDEPEYLKVEEVAARLKLKEKTIRDWILRGELPAYKLGKEWRIRRDHFDEAMEARLVTGEPARTGGLWDPDAARSTARSANSQCGRRGRSTRPSPGTSGMSRRQR